MCKYILFASNFVRLKNMQWKIHDKGVLGTVVGSIPKWPIASEMPQSSWCGISLWSKVEKVPYLTSVAIIYYIVYYFLPTLFHDVILRRCWCVISEGCLVMTDLWQRFWLAYDSWSQNHTYEHWHLLNWHQIIKASPCGLVFCLLTRVYLCTVV